MKTTRTDTTLTRALTIAALLGGLFILGFAAKQLAAIEAPRPTASVETRFPLTSIYPFITLHALVTP